MSAKLPYFNTKPCFFDGHAEEVSLISAARLYLIDLELKFIEAGRLIDWMGLLAVSYEQALKANKELLNAADKKRSQDKRGNAKTLRRGQRRGSVLRKHKQRQNKGSRKV